MSFRSFIRTGLLRALFSRTVEIDGPNFSLAEAIAALASAITGRANFTAAPGKLAILIVAFDELEERGWRGDRDDREFAGGWRSASTRSNRAQRDGEREPSQDCGASRYECAIAFSGRMERGVSDTPALDAFPSASGSWFVPSQNPGGSGAASPRPCVIVA